ncbi:response regulator [Pseudomonas fluorescens]|uniref:Response regulatory domain-containing protein n=1 Tax=Pseudomonas fluorescens TaxID=294 RepID=A0A5E6QF66_PSEFL|nr:response regulator [Pseudomonas fluorescens]VVM54561.1 hypothetical protein PS655_00966 [Pseudomonas fluorescens]
MNEEWGKISPVSGFVIVVEDDPTIRLLMVEILSEIGLQCLDFDNADGAFEHLLSMKENCPLVISDHGLPGQLQGAELIALVKAKWPYTATILTSGYALDPLEIPSSTIYLEKPWSMDELVMAVADLLQPNHPLRKTT